MSINRNKVLAAAQKHVRKGNWEKALREYQRLVDDDSTDLRSLLKIADLYTRLNRPEEAYSAYKTVGDYYSEEGLYEKAIAVYKQALKLDEAQPEIHQQLGEAYYRLGRVKEAMKSFHHAQRIYRERGDGIRQREVLHLMVKLDSDDTGLRIQLAECYAKDGFHDEAIKHFVVTAEKLEKEGRRDEFVQVAERIVFLDPDRTILRKKLVRIYSDRHDTQHALQHLQFCFQDNPKDIETLDMLGQTFERLKRMEKAVLVYSELAQIYQEQKFTGRATDVYRKILEIDPLNQDARKALSAVRHLDDSGVLGKLQQVQVDALYKKPSNQQSTPNEVAPSIPSDNDILDEIEFLDEESGAISESSLQPSNEKWDYSGVIIRSELATESSVVTEYQEKAVDESGVPVIPQDLDELSEIEVLEEISELVEVDAIPLTEEDAEIDAIIEESEVFSKYRLHDMAIDTLKKAVNKYPQSVRAHEKLGAAYEAAGNMQGYAESLCQLACIVHKSTPDQAEEYLKHAQKIATNYEHIEDIAIALGINLGQSPRGNTASDVELSKQPIKGLEEITPVADDDEAIISEPQELTEHESDVYDELFTASISPEMLSLAGEDSIADIAELDFYIKSGLVQEADSALHDIERLKGGGKNIEIRREQVESMRASTYNFDGEGEGEQGLEQKTDTYQNVSKSFDGVENANFELGAVYRELGMYDEAIEEFKQASYEPASRTKALFNVALCEADSGNHLKAIEALKELLGQNNLEPEVREEIAHKLDELSARELAGAQ